jgi:acetamidase/formamidase
MHFFFDLNRDWFAHTQPEMSTGIEAPMRIAAVVDVPHVLVAMHIPKRVLPL